jgi:predicted anti-sigma-YlaC factor YlaD
LVSDYLDGALSDQQKLEVKAHLSDCLECQHLLNSYRQTIEGITHETLSESSHHPLNEDLVSYAESVASMERARIEQIEFHLDLCEKCADKVSMIRAVNAEFTQAATSQGVHETIKSLLKSAVQAFQFLTLKPAWGALTAVLIVLPIAYFLINRPATDETMFQFLTAGEVHQLKGLSRGSPSEEILFERDGYVDLGINFETSFEKETYTAQVRDQSDEVKAEFPLNAENFSAGRGFLIRLFSKSLSPGAYKIVVMVKAESDVEQALDEFHFKLRK